jgi:hypothetical protein
MTNGTDRVTTLDMIHVVLEHLGYVGEEFGVSRIGCGSYGVYRRSGESVTVSSCNGSTVYQISAATAAATDAVRAEVARMGLTVTSIETHLDVHGQEHIDAEVRKMLAYCLDIAI